MHPPSIPARCLTRDLRQHLLVIGAGISGAMIAKAFTEAGLSVAIVDRRGPLRGLTPASTTLLQYELHCYAALGYGGNGIVFSMMAAQLLRGLITGVGDPDADLVSFTRTF